MSKPFLLFRQSELDAAAAIARAAGATWVKSYSPETKAFDVAARQTSKSTAANYGAHWYRYDAPGATVYLAATSSSLVRLAASLLGQPAVVHQEPVNSLNLAMSTFVLSLVARLIDQIVSLSPGSGMICSEETSPPATVLARGVGSMHLSLNVDSGIELDVVLAADAVARLLKPRTSSSRSMARLSTERVTRTGALEGCRLDLEVMLAEDMLAMGDIRSLRPGEVVLFNRRIDQPLHVGLRGGGNLGQCYLGKRGNLRAIRLTRPEQ